MVSGEKLSITGTTMAKPPAAQGPIPSCLPVAGRMTSNAEQLRVFVSYSRDDLDFADQLVIGLEFAGFAPSIDRSGISGGEDWRLRLGNLIRETDTVVFVLSPASAVSQICDWEVREAEKLGKRIIPILCRPLQGNLPPKHLSDLNYIYFYHEPKSPGSGFAAGLASLTAALNTDIEWHRERTRILLRATEWDEGGRQPARLLSGTDIQAAKEWAAKRPRTEPELTELQLAFIQASEEEAEARGNAERRRLAEMAQAQEARAKALTEAERALNQAAEAQRRRGILRNLLLIVMTLAATVSGSLLYMIWRKNTQLTDEIHRKEAALTRAKSAEARARSDERKAQNAVFTAIINECTASDLLLKTHPQDVKNLYNYFSCRLRLGFALIRKGNQEDAKEVFSKVRETVMANAIHDDNPIRSFYLLLLAQGEAIAECAALEFKPGSRSDAIDKLAFIVKEVLQRKPPSSLEERWREEAIRGVFYISNLSHDVRSYELAFEDLKTLVEKLSMLGEQADNARDFARALDHLAWMALITKRAPEALKASEHAIQVVEKFNIRDLPSIRLNYAHALVFNGRKSEARNEYRQLDPEDLATDIGRLISVGLCSSLFEELIGAPGRCSPEDNTAAMNRDKV